MAGRLNRDPDLNHIDSFCSEEDEAEATTILQMKTLNDEELKIMKVSMKDLDHKKVHDTILRSMNNRPIRISIRIEKDAKIS